MAKIRFVLGANFCNNGECFERWDGLREKHERMFKTETNLKNVENYSITGVNFEKKVLDFLK